MEIRLEFFYMILAIHNLFDYNEAASNVQDGKPIKEKRKRWTSQEEGSLIFFDVSTNAAGPNHFARIKAMWHEKYPDSNVTDSALYKKIHSLREESLEDDVIIDENVNAKYLSGLSEDKKTVGERKKNFKWNKESEQELLDAYHNVSSLGKNLGKKLEDEWKQRHPNFQAAGKYLLERARILIRQNKYPEYKSKDSRNSPSSGSNEKSGRRVRHTWTTEWNDRLRCIDKLTNTGEPYQFERIKSKWFEEYPDTGVTENALLSQLRRVRQESQREEYKKNFKWNEESEKELLNIYFSTYPYRNDVNRTLEAEWGQRHQDRQASRKYLKERARKIIKENKYPEYRAQELSTPNFQWDHHHDSELLHIYNIAVPGGGSYLRRAHRIWSALHPEYGHVTPEQLKERVDHLKRDPPDEDFPWTREENQELLKIYDETMPGREDQGQRIYNIWSKRHSEYNFMTPYYLQIHASTLARKRQVEAAGKNVNSGWTDQEKADLLSMLHRFPTTHQNELHAFHQEWVRKHPRLAYKTNSDLFSSAKRFESGVIAPSSVGTERGSQIRALESKRQKHNKYTPRMKQELINLFHRTFPKNHGHAFRLKEKWDKEHEDLPPIKAHSLKRIVRRWKTRGLDERADKAPMEYPANEAGSSFTPKISRDSE